MKAGDRDMAISLESSQIVEDYIGFWLRENEIGQSVLASRTMDEAKQSVWELLNAGFLKITGDEHGSPESCLAIRPCRLSSPCADQPGIDS